MVVRSSSNLNKPLFDPSILESLACRKLFYPCSGSDWIHPILLFAPQIRDFWFVDVNYFSRCSPEQTPPLLCESPAYQHLDSIVTMPDLPPEDWQQDNKYRGMPPYILTETYLHRRSGEIITIHRHRRRGPSALRKEIDRLGIFFYRGDSNDGGGSGTVWLSAARRWTKPSRGRKALIHEVLDKLVNGGLIVTDGSIGDNHQSNPYRHFYKYHGNRSVGREVVQEVQPFEDLLGNKFECVGYAGQRYGPTLVWRVTKPEKALGE